MPVGKIYKVYTGKKTQVRAPARPTKSKPKIKISQLPKSVRPEMKRKNVIVENVSTLVLNNVMPTPQMPFKISAGEGVQQRIGRQAIARGLHIKGHFFNPPGNPAFFVRMVVIQDKHNNQMTFTGQEFLIKGADAVDHNQGTESAYLSVNKKRYKVYSDKLIKLSSANTNAENLKMFNTFIKLNLTLDYDDDTTNTGLTGNNIQVAYWGINPSGAIVAFQTYEANYSTTAYYMDP